MFLNMLAADNLVGTVFNKETAQKFQEHLKAQQQEQCQSKEETKVNNTAPREIATNAPEASRMLQNLSSKQRQQLLHKIANLLAKEEIMQENDKDCEVGLQKQLQAGDDATAATGWS